MSMSYSWEIAEAIRQFLLMDHWNFEFQEEGGFFRFSVALQNKIRSVQFVVDVQETEYAVYGMLPLLANEENQDMMMRMTEFITRANYNLRDGNFELDYQDGEIRYKCYVNCDGVGAPSSEVIRRSILCPVAMFKQYGEGILQMMFTDISPEEAVRLCECPQEQEEAVRTEIARLLRRLLESQRL